MLHLIRANKVIGVGKDRDETLDEISDYYRIVVLQRYLGLFLVQKLVNTSERFKLRSELIIYRSILKKNQTFLKQQTVNSKNEIHD